ncbi:hypothetical protein Vi05172_g2600 [Venturia inaequalis]|nr:hypothetical protein Vi05172_g2600 [Venturia inaequalis]
MGNDFDSDAPPGLHQQMHAESFPWGCPSTQLPPLPLAAFTNNVHERGPEARHGTDGTDGRLAGLQACRLAGIISLAWIMTYRLAVIYCDDSVVENSSSPQDGYLDK